MSQLVPGRLTLGVLVDWLEDVYQNTVLSGVLSAAEAGDVNVICFAGGVLDAPTVFGRRRNHVHALAGPQTVDGVVLLSGTVGNHVGPDRLAAFCARFEGLPLASVGIPLPGYPNFLVDNPAGMEAAIAHLIDAHGRRRIAFVRGPEANAEAESRFEVYRRVLASRGLPFDDALVSPGDFRGPAGVEAIRLLTDDRRCDFDAIVAANDHMALGALATLRARGVEVPGDVAVIGFDDVEDARLASIPLATVRQPLWMQGRLAAESVINRLRGGGLSSDVVLRPEFVPRASCGCDVDKRPSIAQPAITPDAGDPPEVAEIDRAPADILAATLVKDAQGEPGPSFLSALERQLGETARLGQDTRSWQRTISSLRVSSVAHLAGPAKERALDLLDEARLLISGTEERLQGKERLRAEQWLRSLRGTGESILATFDVQGLAPTVATQLPALGIPTCYLATLEARGDRDAAEPQLARLLLAYDEARGGPAGEGVTTYPAAELVPGELLPGGRRFTFVVEPLFFEEIPLGFVVLEMGPREGVVYEALRSQLSTALKGARLVRQLLDEAARREAEERRAGQAMKLESVGRLAAGIAHEINTPIQYVRDSVHFARDSFGDLSGLIERYRSLRADLERDSSWQSQASGIAAAEDTADVDYLVENLPKALERSLDGLERVTTIVRSIKEFAHPDAGIQAPADINKAIENTLVIARNEYKYVAELETDFGALPPVTCHLGEIGQVILNIVVNAAHAIGDVVGNSDGKGLIRIRTRRDGVHVVISIGDTGAGIPAEIHTRIFDPFFTTKEVGRGTGQGLAIAHTVVTVKHGGELTFTTERGKGTTFFIRLPIEGLQADTQESAPP